MSDNEKEIEKEREKEEQGFVRRPRLARSPQHSVWLSLPRNSSDKSPVTKNIVNTFDGEESRRKSVSFNLPATSSTLYHQSDNSFENLINFDLGSESINLGENTGPHLDYSLDPLLGAQLTYSELIDNNKTQVLSASDIHNRPFVVHSLVFLCENSCIRNGIDYDGVLAESSNCRRFFLAERERVDSTANNFDSNIQDQTIFVAQTQEVEMTALSVSAIIGGIDKFNPKSQEDVEAFISSVELYDDLCNENEDLKTVVLKTVRSRLKTVTKLGNVQTLTLVQIIARIKEKFKLTTSFDAAQEKLLSIQQGPKEHIEAFGERTKKLLEQMNSVSMNDNVDIQNAQAAANENLAVRKFKQNLFDKNIRMMSLSVVHTDLYDAISFATEKFEEMRLSNVRYEQPKTIANESGGQRNAPDGKNSSSKMYCHLCKKKNHFTRDCFLKKRNQQGVDQPNKPNENENKSFGERKFNRAGKTRTMNQASSHNADECDESDARSTSSECAQQMQLHTFGVHLNY